MKFLKSRFLFLLSLTVMSMSLSQCSCSDVMGSMFVSEADEVRLGAQFDADLRANPSEYPLYTDPAMTSYVQGIFDDIVAQIPKDEKPGYSFQKVQLIDQPEVVNAFAVPGGYIYVYTGILKAMENESELAAVIGHEVTHVTHHHYRDQLAKQYGVQTLVTMLGGDSSSVSAVAQSLLALKFSRDDEFDADKGGTKLAGAAGWNPLGVATFFSRMGSSTIDWLSTHPASSERVTEVNKLVESDANLKALAASEEKKDRFGGQFATFKAQVK
ncbi:MAG: hypothetical protein RL318_679 [Fibrobacterota bacterium]|jgi:predicted Zn-dependent protease